MEEEILLDMYRRTYDDFLEAFKDKMVKVEVLEKLVETIFERHPSVKKNFKKNFAEIKEV